MTVGDSVASSSSAGITVDATTSGVAVVWLDREERANAFTDEMLDRLHGALEELDEDDAVRCIIVTGRGRYFSTGADLESSMLSATADEVTETTRRLVASRTRPWSLRTPIIGALNGSAVGIGLTLPMQWDIRIMAADAKYGFVFNRRGVMPEMNSLWLLPRLIGLSRAVELLLTGRIFSGCEAVELGLASQAPEAPAVLDVARQLAEDIATNTAPLSTSITKRLVYEALGETDRERAFNEEWELFRWVADQPDATEGITAFLQKRPPRWTVPKTATIPDAELTWAALRSNEHTAQA
jgi:enoyl-CoA hydratase/carnithine racemase